MPVSGYCSEGLIRFRHEMGKCIDQAHQHAVPVYDAKIQYTNQADTSTKLGVKNRRFIQQVTGTYLYYEQAVDATMLLTFSAIASDQAVPYRR